MRQLSLVAVFLMSCSWAVSLPAPRAVLCSQGASPTELLAAKEVRRYIYLRTGALLDVVKTGKSAGFRNCVLVVRKDRQLARDIIKVNHLQIPGPQSYLLKTIGTSTCIIGGDDQGVLYGAYKYAECLGVRFYLHGDVVPDKPLSNKFPSVNETGAPLFSLRGIQPFHDFPEGPDWWSLNEYRSIIAQLPKLRMNFIGLHTYPEPIAEPTV